MTSTPASSRPLHRRIFLPRPVLKAAYRLKRLYHALFRPVTMGVRALVLDGEGRVLLIRHTYAPGWHMPGGAVSRDEPMPVSVERELFEEAGLRATATPRLVGVYANFLQLKSDHVAVYHVPSWEEAGTPPHLGFEIAEYGFYALDDLPAGTTEGTKRRIAEFLKGLEPTVYW